MKTRTFLKSLFAPAFAGFIPCRASARTQSACKAPDPTDRVEFCLTFHSTDNGANYTIEVGNGWCDTESVVKNSQPGLAGLGYDIREAVTAGVRLGKSVCSPTWGRHMGGRSDMFEQVLVRIHRKDDRYRAIIQALSFREYNPGKVFTQTYVEQMIVESADLSDASKDYVMRVLAYQISTRIDPSSKGRFIRWDNGTAPNEVWLKPNPNYVEPPEFRTLPPL